MFQQRRGLSAGQIQWLGRIGLVVSFTIAAFILTRTNAPSNDRVGADPIQEDRLVSRWRSAVGPTGDPKAGTRAIETLQVGDRVLAQNPEVSQAERDGFVEPNWDEWLQLSLAMPKGDGSLLEIELLRPETWVREQLGMVVEPAAVAVPPTIAESRSFAASYVDSVPYSPLLPILREVAATGAELQLSGEELRAIFVEMDLPELAITGPAIVEAIRGPPPIRCGAGRVVTATFHHSSGDVIDLVVGDDSNATESIGTTSNHPFWSVDRQEYVQAGQLDLGERLQTYSGDTKRVHSKLARPGPQAVYNLEVFAEHVYYVGKDGVLVHNSGDIYNIALGYEKLYSSRGHLSQKPIGASVDTLKPFASQVGAKIHSEWGEFNPDLVGMRRGVLGAANQSVNNGGTIHFNLDGFRNRGSAMRNAVARGQARANGVGESTITEMELYWILSSNKLRDSTVFYRNGRIVQNPAALFGKAWNPK